MPALTANYSFNLPTEGSDDDLWGGYLNANWTSIDNILLSIEDDIATLDADSITFAPFGSVVSVTVQDAIQEIYLELGVDVLAFDADLNDFRTTGSLVFTERAAPASTPAAGRLEVFALNQAPNRLAYMDDTGEVFTIAQGAGNLVAAFENTLTAPQLSLAWLDFQPSVSVRHYCEFDNLIPVTDGARLMVQLSRDGGSTWEDTADWDYVGDNHNADSVTETILGAEASSAIRITDPVGNAAGEHGVSGEITIRSANDSSKRTTLTATGGYVDTAGNFRKFDIAGISVDTVAHNAARLRFDSGNIAAGAVIRWYYRAAS